MYKILRTTQRMLKVNNLDLSHNRDSYEIIIVAHRSTHSLTTKIVNDFMNESLKIQYVIQEGEGLPNARNCGLRIASGETIIFFDDDVIIGQGYFSEIKRLMLNIDAYRWTYWCFQRRLFCATFFPIKVSLTGSSLKVGMGKEDLLEKCSLMVFQLAILNMRKMSPKSISYREVI